MERRLWDRIRRAIKFEIRKDVDWMNKNRCRRFFALLLTVLLLAAGTGCSREVQQTPDPGQSGREEQETEQEQLPEEEQKLDKTISADGRSEDSLSAKLPEEKSNLPDNQSEPKTEQTEEAKEEAADREVQDVVLQGLSSEKLGWGPGLQTDENNRPVGATSYQEKYGQYDADFIRENEMNIYLTFDEGYENGFTGKILDVLKEKQVPAVFFVTQPYVESEPELIQRMIDEGHVVGNHSVTHPSLPDCTVEECRQEVLGLHEYMMETFNYEMKLFRFPMGEFSEQDLSILQQLGYRSVFWSFAYQDWLVDDQPDPQEAIQTIEQRCHPGAIYLLHAVSDHDPAFGNHCL